MVIIDKYSNRLVKMRLSVKVFLLLSIAVLVMFVLNHYYNNGSLGLRLILVLGSLPIITMWGKEKKELSSEKREVV
jgi:uncharacterized membrane protein YqjE